MKFQVKTSCTTHIYLHHPELIVSYLSTKLRITAWKNAEGTTILLLLLQPFTIQYAPCHAVEGYYLYQ